MHACASIGVNSYIVLVETLHFETVAPSAMQSLQITVSTAYHMPPVQAPHMAMPGAC